MGNVLKAARLLILSKNLLPWKICTDFFAIYHLDEVSCHLSDGSLVLVIASPRQKWKFSFFCSTLPV